MTRRDRRRLSLVVDSDAWGGAEVYVGHLLDCADENGWQASLVCSDPVSAGFAARLPERDIAVVPLARHAASAPRTRAALLEQQPDAVLVNLVDPTSNAAVLEAALSVAPTVATLHLEGPPGIRTTDSDLVRVRRSYPRLAAVMTPSSSARMQLVDDLAAPPDRVFVVHNGVVPPPPAIRRSRHAPPRIGALGRLTAQKGFDVLLESLSMLLAQNIDVEVVIGGEGRDRGLLASKSHGLPVTLAGFVSDVQAFLADIDVFCLPSRREALPLALLEAMGAGLPCVASDVGEIRTALGGAVRLAAPGDASGLAHALRSLLLHPDDAALLGRRGRSLVRRKFDRSIMAARTYGVIDAVLGAPPRARAEA